MIDTSDDHRVRLREFQAALPFFKRWGLKAADEWDKDPHKVFAQIDKNGGGMVLFDEFADFCLRHGVQQAAIDDDSAEDRRDAMEVLQNKKSNLYSHEHSHVKLAPPAHVAAASMASVKPHLDWDLLNKQLVIGRDPASKSARNRLFSRFDPNGNGVLSLAEVDRGMKRVLHFGGASECTSAINRAFHAARDFAPPVTSFSNDYIDKNEFRVLLIYLKHYIELWEHFSAIDTSGDGRVRLREFQAALPLFRRWGLKEASTWDAKPEAAFSKLDYNGGGVVLFDEFADFCLRAGMRDLDGSDRHDDFEDRREALLALQHKQANLVHHTSPHPSIASAHTSMLPQVKSLVDRPALEAQLPTGHDHESRAARSKLFSRFDINGNAIISLAEVDRGLKQVLELAGIKDCTPAINRAFHAARDIAPPVASFSSDYIDRNEFRVLLVYLKYYIMLWEYFCSIDRSGDQRVKFQEFKAALPLFERWGLKEAAKWQLDPEEAFKRVDYNDGGYILFDEFADFCLRHGLKELCGDDTKDRQDALDDLKLKQPNLVTKDLAAGKGTRDLRFTHAAANDGHLSARSGKDPMRGGVVHRQWESTYKGTYMGTPRRGVHMQTPRSLNGMEHSPGKQAVRSKLDQMMAMHTTGQLETMLKFAGGMIATPR